ncbi:MAG: hypothetical protein AAB853_04500 [Patescibacteria group bacterium]
MQRIVTGLLLSIGSIALVLFLSFNTSTITEEHADAAGAIAEICCPQDPTDPDYSGRYCWKSVPVGGGSQCTYGGVCPEGFHLSNPGENETCDSIYSFHPFPNEAAALCPDSHPGMLYICVSD